MATSSPLQDIPIPDAADAVNVPYDLANAVHAIESRLTMRFSSAGARAAAISSPVKGMLSYLADVDRYESYSGSVWEPVADVRAFRSWTPFTPAWLGTTAPSVGNGSLTGAYTRIGSTGIMMVNLLFGTTTNLGSGFYRFGFPPGWTPAFWVGGSVLIRRNAQGTHYLAIPALEADNTVLLRYHGGNPVSSSAPVTWANEDWFRFFVIAGL